MTEPTATPSAPNDPGNPLATRPFNPVRAHPITSLVCAVLVTASILCTLIVPIYAHITPKVGDFPFFYFYLLAYMPLVAIALWLASLLQRRLAPPTDAGGVSGSDMEAAR
jgi:hypothetical protein